MIKVGDLGSIIHVLDMIDTYRKDQLQAEFQKGEQIQEAYATFLMKEMKQIEIMCKMRVIQIRSKVAKKSCKINEKIKIQKTL